MFKIHLSTFPYENEVETSVGRLPREVWVETDSLHDSRLKKLWRWEDSRVVEVDWESGSNGAARVVEARRHGASGGLLEWIVFVGSRRCDEGLRRGQLGAVSLHRFFLSHLCLESKMELIISLRTSQKQTNCWSGCSLINIIK